VKLERKHFDFPFPQELVAQAPLDSREKSRLLMRNNMGHLSQHSFDEISSLLPKNSLLIKNNTQVFSSRLYGNLPTGGRAQIFLLHTPLAHPEGSFVKCLGKPHKKLSLNKIITFEGGLTGRIVDIVDLHSGPALNMVFNIKPSELIRWCSKFGHLPLPPYIKRKENEADSISARDHERYQTVYAKQQGSVAAPTAGLHFTNDVFEKLKHNLIECEEVTLHVGGGTFLPVKSQDLSEHFMHEESYLVPSATWQKILEYKQKNLPVIVVGTTTFRTLESLAIAADGDLNRALTLCDQWQSTRLFVRPESMEDRYKPLVADYIITNFHQPESTLFMLICSLIGFENAHATYQHAIERKMRLFSYGDACLFQI